MRLSFLAGAVVVLTWATIQACGSDERAPSEFEKDAAPPPSPGVDASADAFDGPWSDFPAEPIVDEAGGDGGTSTPSNAGALFASGTAGTGSDAPCLLEPEIDSLVPRNWLRPRFHWSSASQSIFELRVHAENQVNDLVVYTTAQTWTMPSAMWNGLRVHSAGLPITIALRGGVLQSGTVSAITEGSKGPWGIAPVDAPGSIVYWRIKSNDEGDLKGFVVGDDGVRLALDPPKIQQVSGTACVGCHTSSPDGKYAVFASPSYGGDQHFGVGIASINPATEGQKPTFMTAFGQQSLEQWLKGVTTMSAAHWAAGRHIVVASHEGELRWVNLDATDLPSSRGTIATTGDPHAHPNTPDFNHDGTTIAYVSGDESLDGRPAGNENDIYTVPFNDGAGGTASPLSGASTAEWNEYYPTYAPDGKLLAFNRIPTPDDPYSNPLAEVFVVASAGGTPQRLAANDPPACSGKASPGVENSWPKWAPAKTAPETVNGLTYYWLIFSSTRFGGDNRQLFMAPVVVDAAGTVKPYRAVYLWNQPVNEKNHTPAWDVFDIPPVAPR